MCGGLWLASARSADLCVFQCGSSLRVFSCWYRVFCFFFFFSSRRRHTRSTRDWSSDVCSSDLIVSLIATLCFALSRLLRSPLGGLLILFIWFCAMGGAQFIPLYLRPDYAQNVEIGRASCRKECRFRWLQDES